MVLYKIIIICALSIIFIEYIESVPTFGDEFVHIKVHVPKAPASSRGILAHKQPESPHIIIGSPKVIHHYHRRRKPIKKVPALEAVPLFENTLLAELDKPHHEYSYQNDAKHVEQPHIEETYVVKEEHNAKPITKVNTYTVVEETLHKPLYNKYIHHDKSQSHYHQPHQEYGKENVETFKVIKENEDQHQHYHQSYQPEHVEQHVETIQLVEENPRYNYQQHVAEDDHLNYDYHQPKDETINIIKTPKYKTPLKEYSHYHKPHHEEDEEYHYHQQHLPKDHYNYHEPHHESIEIVKTKITNTNGYSEPYSESGYKNGHSQNFLHEPVKETIEIIKTKKPQKYHYETDSDYIYESKDHYDYQQPQEEIIENKETKYLNLKEEYHHFKETPATNYHYYRQPETIVEEHIYKKPTNDYHYSQQSQSDYDESSYSPSYEAQTQQYIAPPRSPPERNLKFKPSLSYSEYNERPKYDGTYKKSHSSAVNVQQHLPLPLPESAPEFHSSYMHQPVASPAIRQNTHYDKLEPSNVDWPGTADHKVTETYSGYDSYSAAHVQGVGSGGYKYPLPKP